MTVENLQKPEAMKTFIICIILVLLFTETTPAQTDSTSKDIYKAWIGTYDNSKLKSGDLFFIKDSSVTLSTTYYKDSEADKNMVFTKINSDNIDVIKYRKHGRTGTGVLIGALTGIILAGGLDLILYNSYEKEHEKQNDDSWDLFHYNTFTESPQFIGVIAGSVCILGTTIGLGAAIGSAKKVLRIKGNQDNFDQHKMELNELAVKQNPFLKVDSAVTLKQIPDSVTDADGNIYHTKALGGQVWMAEDLRTSRFRNGSMIRATERTAAGNQVRYSWNAVNDSLKICPAGWHVPSSTEWNSLIQSLGGEFVAAEKLSKNFSGTNKDYKWWSSSVQDEEHAKYLWLSVKSFGTMMDQTGKSVELAVRCLRDY
jgi:hypothetical protein